MQPGVIRPLLKKAFCPECELALVEVDEHDRVVLMKQECPTVTMQVLFDAPGFVRSRAKTANQEICLCT